MDIAPRSINTVGDVIKIAGYRCAEQLYQSSRTLVYRAVRERDGQPVVVKLMRNEFPTFSELLQFRNQYTIGKKLQHPGIVRFYGLEPYRNSYALILEDFGGVSLQEYAKNRSLTLAEVLEISIQLTHILHAVHQHQIVHKDIKPSNILIHPQTQEIKLIDFSIASLLPKETQEIQNPNQLEGTLAYLAPEQTGRMNRGIDSRSDFYALGVTLFELLTGQLPFPTDDVMELVYCHIAKHPPLAHELDPEIPLCLSEIVSKLMAKNAEDRYQSVIGLKHDLEQCLTQWNATGEIPTFQLGQRDLRDRFLIPEKLYGREAEVQTLLDAFDRVAHGSSELMLVAGFSGIGKTAAINEVHKPITRQNGYFIKGKFDQFNRNIPLSAFVQAWRDFMEQLLSESDEQLARWKASILEAVGGNGQVLIDVIPALEQIVGKQPPALELSGMAAQNRFNLLFQKFIGVFTTADHPLVLFLDDLQWADFASLQLMKLLMNDNSYLLILGAYRDNEVSPVHPLMLTIKELKKAETIVNTITLTPLAIEHTNHLIADTLHCDEELARPLTQLIDRKTQGNPFFTTQFLKALYDDGYITFNGDRRYWECDIAQINALALTDDVVEFMALQLRKLSEETQQVLKLAACVGNQFDLATLAIVSEQSVPDTAATLWKALEEGLILPTSQVYKFFQGNEQTDNQCEINPRYRFLHDRVQQAAYSLIPDRQKQSTHYHIGQLLQKKSSPIEREEKLFDIVGHLNIGQALIIQSKEREALAQLNLEAGLKARNSTAYVAAKTYLQMGIELLKTDCWYCQYELTLNLYVAATEAAYLNADMDSMERMAEVVLQNAQTIFDKIKIYQIQILALTAQGKHLEAISVGSNAVGQLGVKFPTTTDEAKISQALENLANLQNSREIEEFADLPVMNDRQTLAAMQILGILFPSIIQGIPQLLPIQSTVMVSLSIQFGNAPASSVGYMIHGMVLCAFFGEVKTGYRFGKLGLNLLDQFNVKEFTSLLMHLFGAFIQHHQEAIQSILLTLKEGYVVGMETGDFMDAGYSASNYINASLISGIEIDIWKPEIASYKAALVEKNQYSAGNYVDIVHQTVQNLMERSSLPDCLIGNAYDETVMIPKHYQEKDFVSISIVYIYKLFIAYLFGNYQNAIDYSTEAKKYLTSLPGLIFIPVFHFYTALTHLISFPDRPELEQAKILALVETHQTALQQMAQNAPINYLHKWYLVEAEKNRVLDRKSTALEHYDLAIAGAKASGYIQEEALANELAARFYLDWGKEKVAAGYMQEAYYCYARWGVKAKTDDLEQRYPHLLKSILNQSPLGLNPHEALVTVTLAQASTQSLTLSLSDGSNSLSNVLDFAAILKASQALSSSIELDELISVLTQIILQNCGAQKCILILPQGEEWQVRAIVTLGSKDQPNLMFLKKQSLDNTSDVPIRLINYVKRTLEMIRLENNETEIPGIICDYLHRYRPQSLLCQPILNQGKLVGILYLENQLTKGAFTSDRLLILNLLCTQAAISLENACLYQQVEDYAQSLEEKVEQRTAELKIAQQRIIAQEKLASLGTLTAGVAHELRNPLNFVKNYAEGSIDLTQELTEAWESVSQTVDSNTLQWITEILNDLRINADAICHHSQRAERIIQSMMQHAHTDSEMASPQPTQINELLEQAVKLAFHSKRAQDQQFQLTIETDYGPDLPPIDLIPSNINRAFINLVENACDAVRLKYKKLLKVSLEAAAAYVPTLQVRTRQVDRQIEIRLRDNGCGIGPEAKAKIWDPFFTTKPPGEGTGLGLSLTYDILVNQHQGNIVLDTIPDEYTEIVVTLPLHQQR